MTEVSRKCVLYVGYLMLIVKKYENIESYVDTFENYNNGVWWKKEYHNRDNTKLMETRHKRRNVFIIGTAINQNICCSILHTGTFAVYLGVGFFFKSLQEKGHIFVLCSF